ncbi:hypothetical protein G6O67_000181 [Ophiocordyceps sinensis]|uniref:Uncharacterized protein n=1 Tax=Ophiocordyceps sinensis TaxID=72228 RepID=A0A8H4PYK6_9HYPO|nr:hypothetical protein G6O67_000181 [Ophiocordyceps sinensis]
MVPDRSRYRFDDDGDPGSLYWEHLMDHELTLLRCYFVERMRVLEPQWVSVFESSRLQKDFDLAANSCDSEFLAPHINKWIDAVVAGTKMTTSLYDQIHTS